MAFRININRQGGDPERIKPGDIVTIMDPESYPEFYFQIKAVRDILIISVCNDDGELLTETGVKQSYPRD